MSVSPLGSDIKLLGDLIVSPTGDIQLVSGLDNLKQRIIDRIETIPNTYLFGSFGCNVKMFIDYVGLDAQQQIEQSILAALSEEPLISKVISVNTTQSGNTINIDVSVLSITGESTTVSTSVGGSV